jgi:hypothetical protein
VRRHPGELARARAAREREQALLEAEVRRRLKLPIDQWEPIGSVDDLFLKARARIGALQRQAGSDEGRHE